MDSNLRIKDLPGRERPRERLMELGPKALRNAELIAIILRTGVKGLSAVQVAEQVLQKFPSLGHLARASLPELQAIPGVGRDKAIALQSAFALARRLACELSSESPLLDRPERIADLLREENRRHQVEHFQVVLVNTRRRLIRVEEISQGTLDTLLVHPREVFRCAILANAAALVLVHNHPSGDPSPSAADIQVTRELIRAGELMKIEILDHIILGQSTRDCSQDYASLRELGYFNG